jgi:hypothetical protein
MSDAEIRQAPGWFPALVQVVHDECGYKGPVRDIYKDTTRTLLKMERAEHECWSAADADESGWAR